MNKIVFTSLICLPLFFCFYPTQKQSLFPITPNSQSSIPIENQENTDSCIALAALKITAPENENVLLSPFACPVAFFQTYNDAGGSGNFSTYDLACGGTPVFDAISTLGFNINATDYNPIDNFIYTIRKSDSHLLRLHSDGNFDDVGALALTTNPVIGGFDPGGFLYIKAGNASPIEIVNVNTLAVTLVDPSVNFDGKDWSYHYQKGKFYGVHGGGGGDFLYSYDPATNTVESFPITGLQGGDGPTYGATFYSSDGFIYAANNSTGNIYRLDVDANEAHFILQGANGNGGNDGGSCPFALPQIPIVYAFPDTICALTSAPNTFNIHDNDETHLLPSLDFSTFSILNPPSFGTTSYSNGNLTYTPSGNAQTDILTYQICGTDNCGQLICDYTDVVILAGEDPTFTIENMYCEGEPTAPLPSISDNGILGNWTPNNISNTNSGNYIFTPDALECANSFTLDVTIQTATNPTFSIQNIYCEGETTAALSTISDNGLSGTWTPNIISNTTSENYIFTPDASECANSFTLNVTIQTATDPTFSIQNNYCEGETTAALPTISTNGISGTWTPNNISNTTSGNYIFTPDASECANSFTLNVTIQTATNPTFSIQTIYCEDETTAALPTISDNGISGTWTPNNISNTTSGNYIFTPDVSECANSFTLNITIQTATAPTFSIQNTYCEGETTAVLPTISDNGISGTWTPNTISNSNSGSYIFTPNTGECANPFTLTVTIEAAESPTFSIQNNYCEGETTAALPTTSDDGISGTWTPNTISNSSSGNYFFTPNAGECANAFTLNVTIQPASTPTFSIQDSYCEGETTANLPTSSDNGISGTWTPNTISNSNSGNYIFTPASSECANSFTLNVTIQVATDPTFSIQNTYCEGETTAALPTTSDNGILGNWTPNTISNTNSGNYIFTPNTGECANSFTLNVTIIPQIVVIQSTATCSADLLTYDLEISISGGSGSYNNILAGTFNVVDNGGGNYTIENIPSGSTTSISVTDSENCTVNLTTTPHNCGCPTINPPTGATNNIFCFGENPTAISVDDAPAGFQVNWYSNGTFVSNDNSFTPSQAGTFTATYFEISSSCESAPVTVSLLENPQITITQGAATCSADLLTYDLEISISGGSGIYNNILAGTFNVVDNGAGSYTIENIPSGSTTSIAVTDSENCTANLTTTPHNCGCPSINPPTGTTNNIFCFGENPTAISVDDAPPGFQVNWYFNGTFVSNDNPFTPSQAGTFTATYFEIITGCESAPVTVSLLENPQILITQSAATCSADLLTYDLEISISGGSGFYNNILAGTFNVVDNGAGSYTIENIPSGSTTSIAVIDSENCMANLTTTPHNCGCPSINPPTGATDNIFCFGENPTPISVDDAPAGFQVNWYSNGTFVSNDNPFTPSQAGTFTATYFEIMTGCESTPVNVSLGVSTPSADAGFNQIITCQNTQITLQGDGLNAVNYSWTSNNGFTSSLQNPMVSEAGIYTLTITNADGCTATDEVEVVLDSVVPLASASANEAINCETTCVTLTGNSSLTNVIYMWNGPDTSMDINAPNPEVCVAGIYELVVTIDGTNCSSSPSVVEVLDNSGNIEASISTQSSCEKNQGSITVALPTGGTSPYLFSIDNGNVFSTNNQFQNLSAGSYEVMIQDAFGCEFIETVIVPNPSPLEVALEPLVEIELGENYQLNPQLNISVPSIDTLWWYSSDSLSCADCLNPVANPSFSTTYQITVVDENGCSDDALIQVIVNRELRVFVPNAFSPNGDGNNDRFTIFAGNGVEEIEVLQVFDRWGALVFSNQNFAPNDLQLGWDGKVKGQELNNAVFAYYAKIKMVGGRTEIVQGDVTITK